MPVVWGQVAAMGVMVLVTALAYRRISVAGPADGRALGGDVAHGGLGHRGRRKRLDAAWRLTFRRAHSGSTHRMAMGMGMALSIAMYNFFGYYQVCYLADEVADAVADDSPLDLDIGAGRRVDVPGDERRHSGRDSVARGSGVGPHRQRPDAVGVRPMGGRAGDDDDRLDGVCFGVCRDARLQPDTVCLRRAGDFFKAFAILHPTGAVSPPVIALDRWSCGAWPAWPSSGR